MTHIRGGAVVALEPGYSNGTVPVPAPLEISSYLFHEITHSRRSNHSGGDGYSTRMQLGSYPTRLPRGPDALSSVAEFDAEVFEEREDEMKEAVILTVPLSESLPPSFRPVALMNHSQNHLMKHKFFLVLAIVHDLIHMTEMWARSQHPSNHRVL
ncbi:hypothetical protein C8J55DRAFT_491378 [Lentinula edodes]|uniref:Uncharacterized protein n=1 Tax=Lentinula lateritia TaxID=40482 RepID=A0A9W9DIA4_9AGAR|nr:hypothetical protein C8J55DRAFT_491378 [Lentinula edodes]